MNSLYESILASTNTGKYSKITLDYLLSKGFKEADSKNYGKIVYIPGKFDVHILRVENNGDISLPLRDKDKNFNRYRVENILDLELIQQWWKSNDDKDTKLHNKLKKELLSKLKRI